MSANDAEAHTPTVTGSADISRKRVAEMDTRLYGPGRWRYAGVMLRVRHRNRFKLELWAKAASRVATNEPEPNARIPVHVPHVNPPSRT